MSGFGNWRNGLAVLVVGWFASSGPAATPPAESLLPASTRGFLSVPHVRRLDEAWGKTSFSALWNDPGMKEFRESALARLNKGEVLMPIFFGLTPAEVEEATTGEAAIGLIQETNAAPALVLLLDVTGNTAQADKVLEGVGKRLASAGATQATETIGGEKAVVYSLPEHLRFGEMHRYYFLRKGDCLIASSSTAEIQAVLQRLAGASSTTLATVAGFQETARAQKEVPEVHLRWFAEPLAFLEALRTFYGDKPKEKPDRLQVLKKEGFTGLRGLGGTLVLAAGENEVLARAYLHAPGPIKRGARILDFPNQEPVDPPPWIPRQAGRCLALSLNYLKAFDACSTLFDSVYGNGEQGVFDDLVKGMRDDPDGPGVDIRKEMFAPLQRPLWRVSLRPAPDKHMQWLQGVAVTQEKSFASALRRLFEGDEQVKHLPFGDYGAWKILSEKELPKRKKDRKAWSMPASTLTVARQTWFMAETPELLPIVARKEPPLAEASEYRAMIRRLGREVGGSACLRGFIRNEEELRETWEELRTGTLPADRWERQVLQKLFVSRGDRELLPFDMKKLPAFNQVQQHAGTQTGLAGVTREKGWSLLLLIPRKEPRPGTSKGAP